VTEAAVAESRSKPERPPKSEPKPLPPMPPIRQ
jgi:hypothetical protein